MANKRMFTLKICDSDAFLDMSLNAQNLYFHLNMRADDDGFIDCPNKITRMVGAKAEDLEELINKRFLIAFESGIVVIKHWRMHNTIAKDRYHGTQYLEEKAQLLVKENGAYSLTSGVPLLDAPAMPEDENTTDDEQNVEHLLPSREQDDNKPYTNCKQVDNNLVTNRVQTENSDLDLDIDLEKEKKESVKKESATAKRKRFTPPTLEELEAYKSEARLSVDCKNFLDYYESNGWMVGKNHMKDWKATMRRWSNTQKESARSGTPNRFQNFEQRSEDLDKYMVRNIGRLV